MSIIVFKSRRIHHSPNRMDPISVLGLDKPDFYSKIRTSFFYCIPTPLLARVRPCPNPVSNFANFPPTRSIRRCQKLNTVSSN